VIPVSKRSKALFLRAQQRIPGGVNSPVRAFRSVGGVPRFIKSGKGSRIVDVDGASFIDYVCSWGPLILGHCPPSVKNALRQQVALGTSFGAPTENEIVLAEMITEAFPSIEQVRLVNSGTEAAMSAIRLARAFTGRSKILKFDGCYHGHADSLLVRAGSGIATFGLPDSPGIPPEEAGLTISVPYNDIETVEFALNRFRSEIAAVIVEPVAGNMGCIPPNPGFLQGLREIASAHDALLIFDEVMTGFRVARGGAQALYGVTPDLTTLGKIIGGGLAVGAFGGRAEVMNAYDPRGGKGKISHGGTFNANPVTMAGGVATMQELTPEAYAKLDALGDRLRAGVKKALAQSGQPAQVTGLGSLFWIHWTKKRLSDYRSSRPVDAERPLRTFLGLVNDGVLLTQRGLGCCSLAMTDADVDRFVETLGRVVEKDG
jgi:glutamate-1-semialdehyde 2,1-aminomutase